MEFIKRLFRKQASTVIGDPLYQPYRLNALERLKDLTTRGQGRADWAMVVLYNRRHELTRNLAETMKAIEVVKSGTPAG